MSIQPQLIKLFDNCKALRFENNGKVVKGMISEEGESYDFFEGFKPEGAVETWMNTVEQQMFGNLRRLTKEGVYNYGQKERIQWIEDVLGMVSIVGA